jgi:hypothetical protein
MPDDTRTVPVTFQLDPETATALNDPATRARVEHLVARMVRPASTQRLFDAIRAAKEEAHRNGLTDEIIDEELATYNAERRGTPPAS